MEIYGSYLNSLFKPSRDVEAYYNRLDGSGFDASSFIVVLPSKSSKITFVLNSGEKILKFLTHKTSQLSLKKIKEQIRQDLKTIKISQILTDLRTRVFKNLS